MDVKALLKELTEAAGVSGLESEVSRILSENLKPLVDEIRSDSLGNLVAFKKGSGEHRPKIMLAAHGDEIGLMVERIEQGFLRFTTVGGIDPRTLTGQVVTVHAPDGDFSGVIGVKSPHLTTPEERAKTIPLDELFIDLGLEEEEAQKKVPIGTLVTVERQLDVLTGDRVTGKALDDRAGLAVLALCAEELAHLKHQADIHLVATVQEEVGTRGALVSSYGIAPDIALAVDVTHAGMPSVSEAYTTEMGKGPVIYTGPNIHPRVEEALIQTGRRINCPFQRKAAPGPTGTDARAMQVSGSGTASGLVSVPLRYMHTSVEVIDLKDLEAAGRLLARFAATVDRAFTEGLTCY